MARKSAGVGLTLRQYVTLRTIAGLGGKAGTSDIRSKMIEGGVEVSSGGNLGMLKNMAKVGWIAAGKKEMRPGAGASTADIMSNVWKLTQAGKEVMEAGRKLLSVLAKKEK